MGLAVLLFQPSSAEVDQPLLDVMPCSHDYFQQIMVHNIYSIHNHCVKCLSPPTTIKMHRNHNLHCIKYRDSPLEVQSRTQCDSYYRDVKML